MAKKTNINNKIIKIKKKKHGKNQIINKTGISNLEKRLDNTKKKETEKNLFAELLIKKDQMVIENKNNNNYNNYIKNKKLLNSNNKNLNALSKLKAFLEQKKYSIEYCKKIKKLFLDFLNYLKNRRANCNIFSDNTRINLLKFKIKRININDAYNFIMNNNKYKSESTKYYLLFTMKKIIRFYNNEKDLDYQTTIINPKIKNRQYIKEKEAYSIINILKEKNDKQNLLIFYFLYIKGLNYSTISRILLSNFKNGFSNLVIKKGKKSKHKIDFEIKNKLLDYMREQEYTSKFFFYNNISNTKSKTRAKFIQEQFKLIIEDCFWINSERRNELINYFSISRQPKKNFNLKIFFNDIGFTYGYFDKNISPLQTPKKNNFKGLCNDLILNNSNIDSDAESKSSFLPNSEEVNIDDTNIFPINQ
jgi:hypothetical protein